MVQLVRGAILRAALTLARHANCYHHPADIVIGGYAWLSTNHLRLAPGWSCKLAAKFVGPFWVTDAVGTVSLCFELPK